MPKSVKGSQYGGQKKATGYGSRIGRGGNDEGGKFVDRDLKKVNPNNEQFEPTTAEPVRQRFKMGGGC